LKAKLEESEGFTSLLSLIEEKTDNLERGLRKKDEELAELRRVLVRKQERIKGLTGQIESLKEEVEAERKEKRRAATMRAELLAGICMAEDHLKVKLSRSNMSSSNRSTNASHAS